MGDKFQILVDINKKHAVIERSANGNGKEYWNIYVPDAGERTTATRIVRLLNEEYERDQALRARRGQTEA
jgi:hypothetical protein